MKPFLKWPGNKIHIIQHILAQLPPGKRLIEPFVGSGAVFLNTDYPEYILGDINQDLINLYLTLQTKGEKFINLCSIYFAEHYNNDVMYYALREEFNLAKDPVYKSALFLYLNRHGYNGLVRYNSKGEYNVPFGRYAKPYFPEAEMLEFIEKSKRATFYCADFRETMNRAEPGDVVYCDPPYAPLSETANFTDYSKDGFNCCDHYELAKIAHELRQKGVTVVISNHDTPFTRRLYNPANRVICLQVQRNISCKGAGRGKAPELIAVYGGGI